MEITDRRNTLKTRAFKSDASRPEKFEKNATEPFTPFLMYYTPIALTTLSPEKSLCHLPFFALGRTVHLHHQLCFTRWNDSCHSTGSYFLLALCSQQPSRCFLVWWRRGGRGGTFYLHHQFCFTRWHDSCHSTGSYFFLALCSQQTFRVYWDGGEAGEHFTYHQFCFTGWNDSCHSIYRLLLLSGLMLTASI